MPAGQIQLDSTGRRRLRSTGERILADAAPCCCAECVCTGLPSTLTLTGHVVSTGGVVDCDTDFTITLVQDSENPCIYYGSADIGEDGICGNFPFYLRRELSPCGWGLDVFSFGASDLVIAGNDPTGAYGDVTSETGAATSVYTGLVIS